MNPLLSIIVPVHNVQATLPEMVSDLLDLLSDLARDFEIMIVDNGSTDQTEEVAVELARRFPQVRSAHHSQHTGTPTAVKTGLLATRGEVVFVVDQPSKMSPSGLRELWQLRHDQQLVMAGAQSHRQNLDSGLVQRLMKWGESLRKGEQSNIQMIRRAAIEELSREEENKHALTAQRIARTDRVIRRKHPTSNPNMLSRLQNFATSE